MAAIFSRARCAINWPHYSDVIMSTMASQITSLTIVYSTVNSGTGQRKHQSSASLAFVRGIHRWPMNFPHKGPVTRKMFLFDNVIMHICFIKSPGHTMTDKWKCVIHRHALKPFCGPNYHLNGLVQGCTKPPICTIRVSPINHYFTASFWFH